MLASITPLGERSRGSRYALTAVAFALGSTAAGTGIGALLGSMGALALNGVGDTTRVTLLIVALALLLLVDVWRLPTLSRQVNEEWMHAYRGWVYGFGYGVQLGAGVATVVTTAAVYGMLAAAFFSASPVSGLLIGGTFGLIRGMSLFAGAGIRSPRALVMLDATLRTSERWARSIARSGQAAIALVCLGWLVR